MNAAYFTGRAQEWAERVQGYVHGGGSPAEVPVWPEIEDRKTTFIGLYTHPAEDSAQGAVLDALRAHRLTFCPACGEMGKPNTLDHFLPKRKYPHFAIVPHNLFPMCDACQGKKLEKTGDEDAPKFFIHPYFDRFTSPRVVKLAIDPPYDTPTFTIGPSEDLLEHERTLVAVHLRELAIEVRFTHFFREEYIRLLRLMQDARDGGQNCAALLALFRGHANSISPNSWQHIFYDSVLNNPDLVDYLATADLPELL
ncbi:HNH endonuclease [Rhizobium altiplani]|uniref:HNH endonuclease n=1 Tax=Rhizobium altiplani TaxID=1864509 RepID=UPI001428A934|nr:HNH endonuclease [Rhizobium altiplani]